MKADRLLRGLARIVFGVTSLGAFGVFAWTALHDQTATATVAAGLGLALAILSTLDLESFEGLGIKAQLRSTLSDAEARLNSLDALIRTLARGAFVQTSRGGMTDQERRTAVDEMTASLQGIGVSAETIETFKRPIYGYIANRLGYVAMLVRSNYLGSRVRALDSQEQRLIHGPERDAVRAERERLSAVMVDEYPSYDNYERFRAIVERMAVETPVILPEHRQILIAALGEISDLFEECRRAGNLTERAMAAMGPYPNINNPYAAALAARLGQEQA